MRRRAFIAGLAGAALLGNSVARAQRAGRRVAVFISGSESDPEMQEPLAAFKETLRSLKWVDGANVRIDHWFADGKVERYTPIAKEIVATRPDVILVRGTPNTAAVLKETRTIPIVFVGVSDPVGAGLIESLARPGGNVTGHLLYEPGIAGKWLALLKEVAPAVSRAVLMSNPRTGPFEYFVRSAKTAAPVLGIELEPGPVETAGDIERLLESVAAKPNCGLVVLPDASTLLHRDLIISLAARHRIPAVYSFRVFVNAGGLMSYDSDITDHYRQAAAYIDRVLRGAKPSELPAQTPTRYETIINLKTAKALGLTVPSTLLVRADAVIE